MICSGVIVASVLESYFTGTSVGVADGSGVAVGVRVSVAVGSGKVAVAVMVACSVGAEQAVRMIETKRIIFFIADSLVKRGLYIICKTSNG